MIQHGKGNTPIGLFLPFRLGVSSYTRDQNPGHRALTRVNINNFHVQPAINLKYMDAEPMKYGLL